MKEEVEERVPHAARVFEGALLKAPKMGRGEVEWPGEPRRHLLLRYDVAEARARTQYFSTVLLTIANLYLITILSSRPSAKWFPHFVAALSLEQNKRPHRSTFFRSTMFPRENLRDAALDIAQGRTNATTGLIRGWPTANTFRFIR
uniref:Uncharacterized protein n=1 Tax=Vespula pensylvanica TaxID=30213 RepID=A0A836V247_VESPE|nr:hypothetical protein H0235_013871 [Vespula pensylvanica]